MTIGKGHSTMSAVVTLTLNPAVDVSASVERVEPDRKLRCEAERRDPGGGGVNVARVAARFGAETTAVFPTGGCAGDALIGLIRNEGVICRTAPIAGDTREDFSVLERSTGRQYRFVLPGPVLAEEEWKACLGVLASSTTPSAVVCASGSLPPGAPTDFYALAADQVSGTGGPFLLDTSGPALRAAVDKGRFTLIKPNLQELRELTGAPLADERAMIAASRSLIEHGAAKIVALTLGPEGALLITSREAWRAHALPITPISTVGAGDSFLGAMAWAFASALPLPEAFRYAMAAASAALLAPGTELCRPEDVRRLLDQARIEACPEVGAARPKRTSPQQAI
ncbi:MAG: 1-phosphofructokinase family hexose kinase [Caulobacteraceae bacterium]